MSAVFLPQHYRTRPYAAKRFSAMVSWASTHHPLYKKLIPNPLENVPLLDRSTILQHNDELLNGHPETGRTSGSTGIPIRFSWSPQRRKLSARESKLYTNSWLGGALPRTRIIRSKGEIAPDTVDISSSPEQQVSFIHQRYSEHGAVSIITYPTNAAELSQYIIDNNINMSFVQRFSCYAEAFEPRQEQLVGRAFPEASIYSTYSATEIGMIAARCPHHRQYSHVFATKIGLEILDDNGQMCQPGQLGRVVITDYFNRNSPFIRYDIGDLAAYGDCPCGKIKLPAITNISGKVRGLLRKANGEKIMFSHLDAALRDVPGMAQFQVIQHSLENFTLRFVAASGYQQLLFEQHAKALFVEQFGAQINLAFKREHAIERGRNGKFYASICELDNI